MMTMMTMMMTMQFYVDIAAHCSARHLSYGKKLTLYILLLLPPTKEDVNAFARVCSVCLSVLARLLKNACMDLDDMLRVDRRRDMDEMSNF